MDNQIQIANPQGVDFKQGLKDWVKMDYLKSNSFWSRRSGGVAMATAAIIGVILVGGVVMNLGAILFWIGALVAKIIVATVVGVAAFLLWNDTTRTYIKNALVGFFESITLEYVRKHPMVAFSAFWSYIVDQIQKLNAAIVKSKSFRKSLDGEIAAITAKIENANAKALDAEKKNDNILKNSFLNMVNTLISTKEDYLRLCHISDGYVENATALLKIANSKKTATENEIEVYKTRDKFNMVSSDLLSTMRGVLFPDQRILNMYNEAKSSIDGQFDDNLAQMDTLMDQLNSMPSIDSLQSPESMQAALKQFDEFKQKSLPLSTPVVARDFNTTTVVDKKELTGDIVF